jgi:hypothetical protein
MKIDESILEKMVKRVKTTLSSFHSHVKKARKYVRWYINGMTEVDREFIIKEILHQQNRSIIKAIENKKNIGIPSIGSFQYRESLEIIKAIKQEVKAEMGIEDIRKVDEETYIILNNKMEERKKSVLIPLYFKQLNIKGNSVNHQFLNKIKNRIQTDQPNKNE